MGRPTECTPEMINLLVKLVDSASSIKKACALVDISQASYCMWMQRGRQGEKPFSDFLEAIEKAEAQRTLRRLKQIEICGNDRFKKDANGNDTFLCKGDWQALAWLEERQNRKEFGRFVSKIELSEPPPHLSDVEKVIFLSNEIVQKMSCGEISAEEANLASQVIEHRRKALETSELAKRLENVEKIISETK